MEICHGRSLQYINCIDARVAELADALDLGSNVERRTGSSPVSRTKEALIEISNGVLFLCAMQHITKTLQFAYGVCVTFFA